MAIILHLFLKRTTHRKEKGIFPLWTMEQEKDTRVAPENGPPRPLAVVIGGADVSTNGFRPRPFSFRNEPLLTVRALAPPLMISQLWC